MLKAKKFATFTHPEYGELNVAENDGKVLYGIGNIVRMLKFSNVKQAVYDYTADRINLEFEQDGKVSKKTFVPEQDVKNLIKHNPLENANQIGEWILKNGRSFMKPVISEIKTVPFMGSELVAARDTDNQIWVGVRWMCDGIGLSKGQMQRERIKIKEDQVLSNGELNLVLPTNGGMQETLCIKLDFVPLWLAKIAITPNMKKENPELVERLMEYQLKAKDVLAAAFISQEYSSPMSDDEFLARAVLLADKKIACLEAENKDLKNEIQENAPLVRFANGVTASKDTIALGDMAKLLNQNNINIGRNRLFECLRNNGYLIKRGKKERNMPTQKSMDMGLFEIEEKLVTYKNDGTQHIEKTSRVTGKGQRYFIDKFLSGELSV